MIANKLITYIAVTPSSPGKLCPGPRNFFGMPSWYKYLNCDAEHTPQISSLTDIWNIAWAVVEIILYIGGIAAVFFIIYGGIQFVTSQGQPDKTAQARKTLTYAIAGLVIAIIATVVVRYVAGLFGAGTEVGV